MAQIDPLVLYEVVVPLHQIDITSIIGISTITDENNFMTKYLKLKENEVDTLTKPRRTLMFSFPVPMDNGKTKIFTGYRVQFNDARGPTKGDIRFHPKADLEEVSSPFNVGTADL